MYKRHSISALIGVQRFIALIGSLTLIVGFQHASAQQQVAQDAYAIFEASCLICHGPDGAYRETLLMEHSELIEGGTVVPGNPNASELYKRLLGPTENGVQMPFGQPQLPAQSIDTIRRWILAGAPDWATIPTTNSQFISPDEILKSIETHLTSLEPFDRAFARYFTLTHLYNANETPEILREYRKALSKLVNSLSWGVSVINPQPIDSQATIFYIDLRHYEWDRIDGWTKIEEAYPYLIAFDAPAQTELREQLGRLQTQMNCVIPSVHIDWFLATASTPPLYHELLSLPLTDGELEQQLDVDVVGNLTNAPGVRVWRAGFNNSGVSNNNRVVERHTSRYGAYWKSYDFAGSVGEQNIFTHPLNFTHDGGEVIFNLPNGLQGYYLVNASSFRLDEAPINIVSNPAASDPTVRNGLSCIGCHTEGMKTFEDQVRSVIESNSNPPYNKAQALRLYVEKSDMDARVGVDMERYREALVETGGVVGGVEPISRFHEAFHGPVDAAYAAAVVGLETETFLKRIRENAGLQSAGLLVLDGGQIKRDTWKSSFQNVIHALDYPQQVGEPPIVTQPEVIPGRLIDIPDPNLRALLEETLGTKAIRPSTMATLTTLNAKERNISDITGLQFAVNLEELNISGNPISGFSPLAGCTNLIRLFAWDTPNISDISPLANLTKLEQLEVTGSDVHDISSLVRLTNLRVLQFYSSDISDISPLSGMTKLEKVRFRHSDVEDITPLANLVHLEWLDLASNEVSDLSPLRNLTKLESADLSWNRISNIEPLRHLTSLTHLRLDGNQRISDVSALAGLVNVYRLRLSLNKVSDVSPLAGLTRLATLTLEHNEITDFSPLAGLPVYHRMHWHNNPGFYAKAPKIKGPWLWVFQPNAKLDNNTDLLSKSSGGMITEVGVSTNGAIKGKSVGNDVWTFHKLPSTGQNNLGDMLGYSLPNGVIFGSIALDSPKEQHINMYAGSRDKLKVWLNGVLIYERLERPWLANDYIAPTSLFSATLQQGRNILLVAASTRSDDNSNVFFGFEPDTSYSLETVIDYVFSQTSIHVNDTFTLDIRAENVLDLAGWQFDIAFNPSVLEAVDVSEGDFLKTDGGATFFQSGRIDNAAGKIIELKSALLSDSGVSGSGTILRIKLKAKSEGETSLEMQNFLFGSFTGENIPAGPHEITLTVTERLLTGDVNRDGVVNILDLILVARQLGKRVSAASREDVNGDGVVNIFDLTLVAQGIGKAAAPPVQGIDSSTIESWIAEARLVDDGSIAFRQGIANLQNLLASLIIPQETALHPNYPNPFNPETWIPYQLAVPAEVALTIYDMNGGTVRRFEMGHQAAGAYQSRSRAAYWDGRNGRGESVASGLYFYTLRAGEFTATRKMLIRK